VHHVWALCGGTAGTQGPGRTLDDIVVLDLSTTPLEWSTVAPHTTTVSLPA
jgi:hypothetical protein